MVRIRRLTVAALVLAAVLAPARPARAGQLWDWLCGSCPPPSYSPARLWAPRLARVSDRVHGPKVDVYPPDRHPEVPPDFIILKYPCPAVEPAATLIERPTPPATSRFRY
jgi:hypothetical protein